MKICHSCGMPLDETTTSKHNTNYCIHCQNQESGEIASFGQVKEGSINAAMKYMGKTREEAEKMVNEMLPNLPHWKRFKDKT